MSTSMDIECPDCGAINEVAIDSTDQLTKAFWLSLECEECGSPLFDEEEDYIDEPPISVSSPAAPTNASGYDEMSEPEEVYEAEEEQANAVMLGTGINQKTNRREVVTVGDVERRGGVYLLGQPRTGKTTLLINLIVQDIKHGHGICFIDPHGDGIEDVLKLVPEDRLDDVILLDPLDEQYTVGFNLFACKDPKSKKQISRTINYVLQVFGKLFTESGDLQDAVTMYDTLLNTIILLVYNQAYTLAEVPLLLVNRDAAAKLVEQIGYAHDDEKEWWLEYNRMKFTEKNEVSGSTRRRLRTFLTDEHIRHIVGQNTSTLDLRAIMETGKILLVKLPREFPELSKLVGSLLIGQLLTAAYSRDDTPERDRRQFCLYCDEFQNFATPDFAELFTQTGKYHLAPTVAHQERVGQFAEEQKILGATSAAAIKIFFQTTVKDADELAPEFARPPQEAWEEEIEPIRFERVEEQIADEVEEDILEISQNPLDFLVSYRGTHISKDVQEITQRFIIPTNEAIQNHRFSVQWESQLRKGWSLLNTLLVSMMSRGTGVDIDEINTLLKTWPLYGWQEEYIKRGLVEKLITDKTISSAWRFNFISRIIEDERVEIAKRYGKDFKFSNMEYKVKLKDKELSRAISFFGDLITLCEELAENPIRVPTGQKRLVPKMRTHLTYHTIPAKTIMHPKQTEADMVGQMRRELINLPRFTAYCKIVTEVAGTQQVVKYKLFPDPPLRIEDEATALDRKKAYITLRMHDETLGYYRKRDTVEQEIAARRATLKTREPKQKGQTTLDEDED